MLTLYAPLTGLVETDAAGATVVASGPATVQSPGRGVVEFAGPGRLVLTDLRDRVVEVISEGGGTLEALVESGAEVGFDQPLVALGEGQWRVSVRAADGVDVMPHAVAGTKVVAGDDLMSIGPFSCGA